jgi:methionyl-tRNA formyltransferase
MSFKIVFMGTPSFAEPMLDVLIEGPDDILCVVTQPDRPMGRGRRLQPSPIKRRAQEANIPVLEPVSAKDDGFISTLCRHSPDVIVLVAFGQLLPEAILHLPQQGCLNVHPSLLPKYRGAAPVQWAIINGEHKTGVTVFRMDKRLDAGDILLARETVIGVEENAQELAGRLSMLGTQAMMEALRGMEHSTLKAVPQKDEEATYAPQFRKEDGVIRWESGADRIERLVRGLYPWPGTYTSWKGQRLKVHRAKARRGSIMGSPGEVLNINQEGIWVQTGDGYLEILEVQLENRPRMTSGAFLKGHRDVLGDVLG